MNELPVILVIEDEDSIQTVVEEALTEGGLPLTSLPPAKRP
jgi:CheY-like chemotaxis protein